MSLTIMTVAIALDAVPAKKVGLMLDPAFVQAIALAESGNDPYKVGDLKLTNHAYGIFQIRLPVLKDVNETYHTRFTIDDIRPLDKSDKERVKSIKNSVMVMRMYLERYGKHYEHVTGLKPTMETMARMWNGGGPNGWNKESTEEYWQKVKLHLDKTINKEYIATGSTV